VTKNVVEKKGFSSMRLDWTGKNRSKRFPIIERKERHKVRLVGLLFFTTKI
jgi:hypothetical protein